jgi:hypothetical protein
VHQVIEGREVRTRPPLCEELRCAHRSQLLGDGRCDELIPSALARRSTSVLIERGRRSGSCWKMAEVAAI